MPRWLFLRSLPACVVALCVLTFAHRAEADPGPDGWRFALTPYLWLPNVNGTLKYSAPPGASGSPEVGAGPNNYLENLSAALMLSGEARNGRWSLVSDFIYLDFRNEESSVRSVGFGGSVVDTSLNSSTKSSLTGVQWLVAGGYAALRTPSVMLDVIGGFRYLGIEAKTDWQLAATVAGPGGQTFPASGSASKRTDLLDAIIGIRGRVRLDDTPWFVPYHLDIGTGSSNVTWQGFLGIAYAFKWGDATLGYRSLYYDQADDKLLQNFRFSGPTLGAAFRF